VRSPLGVVRPFDVDVDAWKGGKAQSRFDVYVGLGGRL
jgi:hypothetical protein